MSEVYPRLAVVDSNASERSHVQHVGDDIIGYTIPPGMHCKVPRSDAKSDIWRDFMDTFPCGRQLWGEGKEILIPVLWHPLPSVVLTGWNVFNQNALFKGYKKRLSKLPKAKAGSDSTKMVRHDGLNAVEPSRAELFLGDIRNNLKLFTKISTFILKLVCENHIEF